MEDDPFDDLIEWQMMEDYMEETERQDYELQNRLRNDPQYYAGGQNNLAVWLVVGIAVFMMCVCLSLG